MDHLKREELTEKKMLGRVTSAAIGLEGMAAVAADDAFAGYATFAPKYGEMKPHYHENEIMYVVDAKGASVIYGPTKDMMNTRDILVKGDIIRARNGEWHKFEFDSDDGFLDLIAFFAVPMSNTIEPKED